MKVKVEFNVDIEDVPKEAKDRIKLARQNLNFFIQKYELSLKLLEENNLLEACNSIDESLKEISRVSNYMKDSYNVLMGYTNYKSKGFLSEESEVQKEPDENV